MNRKELLLVSITVFFTIVAWIIADLYHISTTERYKIGTAVPSTPVQVSIDEAILEILEQKK